MVARAALNLTASQAATRVAMFFERVRPDAMPNFPNEARTVSIRIRHEEFRELVDRQKYEEAFHDKLVAELYEYSLLLLKKDGYFLLIGWQNPETTPPSSYADTIRTILGETKEWTDQRYAEEWDKIWPPES